MLCSELLTRLNNRGVVVQIDDDGERLRIINYRRVLPDERLALQRGKQTILQYLRNRPEPPEPTGPGSYWLCSQRNRWISSADEPMPNRFMGTSIHIGDGYGQ